METKHTATPWKLEGVASDTPHIVADMGMAWKNPVICSLYDDVTPEDSVTIGAWLEPFDNAEANAAFIVQACNAHTDLVALLRGVEEALRHNMEGSDRQFWRARISNTLSKVTA